MYNYTRQYVIRPAHTYDYETWGFDPDYHKWIVDSWLEDINNINSPGLEYRHLGFNTRREAFNFIVMEKLIS